MSRRVSFKLYSKDAAGNPTDEERLALAFQRHCEVNFGLKDDLNVLAKRIFMKFLHDAVDRNKSKPEDLEKVGVLDESGEAVTSSTDGTDEVASESIASNTLADSPTVSSESAATT